MTVVKRKWMTSRYVTVLLWLILAVGIVMVLYPKIDSRIQEKKQLELLSEWSKELQSAVNSANPIKTSDETETVADQIPIPQWMTVDGLELLGSVRIDSIEMIEPIVRGTEADTLLKGAGTVIDGRMPGQVGNFVLAGHRSWTFGRHFNRLGELKPSDIIDIETSVGTFRYEVTDITIVTPDDVSVLEEDDSSTLTLITCNPKRNPTHRLIVKAILKTSIIG